MSSASRRGVNSDSDSDGVVLSRDDVIDDDDGKVLPLPEKDLASIRARLKPTPYDAEYGEYRKHLGSHLSGTGEWLLESESFRAWRDGESSHHGLLWIKGIPGSGKSVMAASLAHRLAVDDGVPVLYFFFRQSIEANRTPVALVRDWLAQLLVHSPPLQVRLKNFRPYMSTERFSVDDLWENLETAITSLPKAYLVVDALDEMDQGNDAFIQKLTGLGSLDGRRWKVLLTSRPTPDMEGVLRPVSRVLQVRLDPLHVDQDIAAYVSSRLSTSSIPEPQQDLIKKAIPGQANGVFLYAKFAMDALLQEDADVHKIMERLPTGLNDIYNELLRKHARNSGISRSLQVLILSMVTHSARPLRLLELADAIRIDKTIGNIHGLRPLKELVRAACGPLLEILPDETVSVIHHSLTEFLNGSSRRLGTSLAPSDGDTDHFPVLALGTTHSVLARTCVSYMLQPGRLDSLHARDGKVDGNAVDDTSRLVAKYPFLAYCVGHSHSHLKRAELHSDQLDEDLLSSVDKLFSGQNLAALSLFRKWGREVGQTALHTLTLWDLSKCLGEHLDRAKPDVNSFDRDGNTPLLLAASMGNIAAMKTLLAHGADPDRPSDYDGQRPLHAAVDKDNGPAVELLLATGVDPLTPKTKEYPDADKCYGQWIPTEGATPLMYAIRQQKSRATAVLLRHLTTPPAVSNALLWAAEADREDLVRSLLGHPLLNINAKVHGDTPLFAAAKKQHLGIVVILLEAGADPSIMCAWDADRFSRDAGRHAREEYAKNALRTDRKGRSYIQLGLEGPGFNALHSLCGASKSRWGPGLSRHEDQKNIPVDEFAQCVQRMVKAGIDLNVVDEYGATPLRIACQWSPSLVGILLEAGADPEIALSDDDTCIHVAKHPDIVQQLVEVGRADVNSKRRSDGLTPLLAALQEKKDALVLKLLELGADPHCTDKDGRGALHIYLKAGGGYVRRNAGDHTRGIVEALLKAGLSPESRDHDGNAPIHSLKDPRHQRAGLEALVAAGADINARDGQGNTLLLLLARAETSDSKGYAAKFDQTSLTILMVLGAQMDVRDAEGCSVLCRYLEREAIDRDIIRIMVRLGADPHAVDDSGNTLWHRMCIAGPAPLGKTHLDVLKELGVDVEARNSLGRSALHFLVARQSWEELDKKTIGAQEKKLAQGIELFPVDTRDNLGIRPLHIAAQRSHYDVAMLLAAGASPTEPTYEGMTPLHVAARFRQPNIVGLLLEELRSRYTPEEVMAHVNMSRQQRAPSALHIACRSGVAETVALLLAAGADARLLDDKGLSPLMWCIQYEEKEEPLWRSAPDSIASASLGMAFDDNQRLRTAEGECKTRGSLEDILDMLHGMGPRGELRERGQLRAPPDLKSSSSSSDAESLKQGEAEKGEADRKELDKAILRSLEWEYTTACLVELWCRLAAAGVEESPADVGPGVYLMSLPPDDVSLKYTILSHLRRRQADLEAFIEMPRWRPPHTEPVPYSPGPPQSRWLFNQMLHLRQWDVIRYWFNNDPAYVQIKTPHDYSILCSLVISGLDSLLADVLTPGAARELHDRLSTVESVQSGFQEPLLHIACYRIHGNLPMLRCLVEKLHVDVNGQSLTLALKPGEGHIVLKNKSALHLLAEGNTWWHAAEGLPYLLARGAQLELRDYNGWTPLMYAVDQGGLVGRRAARVLIEAGADVNAADSSGMNLLTLANGDPGMIKLLMDAGAKVRALQIFSAIKQGDAALLDMWCQYAHPDSRHQPDSSAGASGQLRPGRVRYEAIHDRDRYPLYYAALHVPRSYVSSTLAKRFSRDPPLTQDDVLRRHAPCIEVLLQRGASLFVRYAKGRRTGETVSTGLPWAPFDKEAVFVEEEATLLHDLLEEGGLVAPIFEHGREHLDTECRDARGRTLLLAACCGPDDPDFSMDAIRLRPDDERRDKPSLGPGGGSTGKPSVIELLLDRGACATAQDKDGRNALHTILEAHTRGGLQSLRRLISSAPELMHQVDVHGETPLHYALRRVDGFRGPDTHAIEVLVEAGADIQLHDKDGNTALHVLAEWLAASRTDGSLTDLFLRFVSMGLPINGGNHKGQTPISCFLASRTAHQVQGPAHSKMPGRREKEVLDWLLKQGADVLATDSEGDTLLHVVASINPMESQEEAVAATFRWLMDRGLDPMKVNKRHQTSVDVAALNNQRAILEIFGAAAI